MVESFRDGQCLVAWLRWRVIIQSTRSDIPSALLWTCAVAVELPALAASDPYPAVVRRLFCPCVTTALVAFRITRITRFTGFSS